MQARGYFNTAALASKYLLLVYNVVKYFSLSVYLVVTKCEWTERVKLYPFGYMSHHHGEEAKTMRLFLTVVNKNRGGLLWNVNTDVYV